jgi:hypothetical protein
MRPLAFAAVLLAFVALPQRALAVDYPWCVHYSQDGDVSNCGFVSWEQCRMTATGAGGFCAINPLYAAEHPAPKAKLKHTFAAKHRPHN